MEVHPISGEPISTPRFWHRSARPQPAEMCGESSTPTEPSSTPCIGVNEAATLAAICANFKMDLKPFALPEPDEPRFRLAVLGRSAAEDVALGFVPPTEAAQQSSRCVGAAADGKDALANNIVADSRRRGRFKLHTDSDSEIPTEALATILERIRPPGQSDRGSQRALLAWMYSLGVELMDCIKDTKGACSGSTSDVAADMKVINAYFSALDDEDRSKR